MCVAGGRGREAGTKRSEYHFLLVQTLLATSLPAPSRPSCFSPAAETLQAET
jgi:hypothetical protein